MNNYDHLIGKNVRMVLCDGREFTGTLRKDGRFYRVGSSGLRGVSLVSIEPLEFVEGCVATFPNGNKVTRESLHWVGDDRKACLSDGAIRFTGAQVTWPEPKKFDEEREVYGPGNVPGSGMIVVPPNLVGKKVRVVEL